MLSISNECSRSRWFSPAFLFIFQVLHHLDIILHTVITRGSKSPSQWDDYTRLSPFITEDACVLAARVCVTQSPLYSQTLFCWFLKVQWIIPFKLSVASSLIRFIQGVVFTFPIIAHTDICITTNLIQKVQLWSKKLASWSKSSESFCDFWWSVKFSRYSFTVVVAGSYHLPGESLCSPSIALLFLSFYY